MEDFTLLGVFVYFLLFGLAAGSGSWYWYRAKVAGKGVGSKLGWGIFGVVLFLIFFLGTNGILNAIRPRWWYRLVLENDEASYILVLLVAAGLNYGLSLAVLRDPIH